MLYRHSVFTCGNVTSCVAEHRLLVPINIRITGGHDGNVI